MAIDWSAIAAIAAAIIPLGAFVTWFFFGRRAKLVYDVALIRGQLRNDDGELTDRIEAAKIVIKNVSFRHLENVKIRVRHLRGIRECKASFASTIDVDTIDCAIGETTAELQISDVPAREQLHITVFHKGWMLASDAVSGGSGSFRIITKTQHHTEIAAWLAGLAFLSVPAAGVAGYLVAR